MTKATHYVDCQHKKDSSRKFYFACSECLDGYVAARTKDLNAKIQQQESDLHDARAIKPNPTIRCCCGRLRTVGKKCPWCTRD